MRWLQRSPLGKVVQFTSFGLSGMVITDLMSKLDYDVPVAFIDTLHHFDEVSRNGGERAKEGSTQKKTAVLEKPPRCDARKATRGIIPLFFPTFFKSRLAHSVIK